MSNEIQILGGAGGKGGGGESQRQPREATDTLESKTLIQMLELISEGEIEGYGYLNVSNQFVKALTPEDVQKGIYFGRVPVRSLDGTVNFPLTNFGYTLGTQNQPSLAAASSVSSVFSVGFQLQAQLAPYVFAASQEVNEIIVAIRTGPLLVQDRTTGDINGNSIVFQYEVNLNNTGFVEPAPLPGEVDSNWKISGKTRDFYIRNFSVRLPDTYTSYQLRITRLTPDSTSTFNVNPSEIVSITEVKHTRLTYPNSAIVGFEADSRQFNSIPERSFLVRGVKIQVPKNYNPLTRLYATFGEGTTGGHWDGTFKPAWTDNPAWIFYDLLTERRYGLGEFIPASYADKWGLYAIGKYCDELVDDGVGGEEPRFTCSTYFQQKASSAYEVLKQLASVFRGMFYWSAGRINVVQDREGVRYPTWDSETTYSIGQFVHYELVSYVSKTNGNINRPPSTFTADWLKQSQPADAEIMFGRSNVENGMFTYTGTAARSRHTVAHVAWNDPTDFYEKKVEYVEDRRGVDLLGINVIEVTAFGCKSRGQAHRLGKWSLLTELHETETVKFRCGNIGAVIRPGMIVSVSDPLRSLERLSGRVVSATTTQVTLDSAVLLDTTKTYALYLVNPQSDLKSDTDAPATETLKDFMVNRAVVVPGVTASTTIIDLASALSDAPTPGSTWMLTPLDVPPQNFRILGVAEIKFGYYEVVGLEYVTGKFSAVESDIELEENPSFALPNPFDVVAPTTLVVKSEFVVSPQGLTRRISVSWRPGTGSSAISHYVVEYSYQAGNWIAAGTTASPSLSFEVISAAIYTIRVKAVNSLNQSSSFVYATFTLTSEILSGASITGLEISGQGYDHEFSGNSPRFDWRFNSPDTSAELGDSAQGGRHPLLRGYIVQVKNISTGLVVRQEEILDATYTYTLEKNTEDNGVPLRRFIFRVAAVDLTSIITEGSEILVENKAPFLGGLPPNLSDQIRISVAAGEVSINITPPSDPDLVGYLVWVSYAASPTLNSIVDGSGNIRPEAFVPYDAATPGPLVYQGPNTQIKFRPIAGISSEVHIAVAAYDSFGFNSLFVYGFFPYVLNFTIDTVPPQVPNLYTTRTRSDIGTDGTELVRITALFYPGGLTLAETLAPWTAPDNDLVAYHWSIREVNGVATYGVGLPSYSEPQIFTPITGIIPARLALNEFAQDLDPTSVRYLVTAEWVVKPNVGYEIQIAAADSSGNVSAFTPLDALSYRLSAKDTTPPGAPLSGALSAAYRTMFVEWVNAPDADLLGVNVYVKVNDSTPPVYNAGGRYWQVSASNTAPMPVATFGIGNSTVLGGLDEAIGTTYHVWLVSLDLSENLSTTLLSLGSIVLGSIPITDLPSSPIDITSIFGDVVTMSNLVVTNNSNNGIPNSLAGSIHWSTHTVNFRGVIYTVAAGASSLPYIYWNVPNPAVAGPVSYTPSAVVLLASTSPQPHFLILENISGVANKRWFYAANAVLGSAWIENLAVKNAMIDTLTVDKLRSGTITAQTITLAGASCSLITTGVTDYATGTGVFIGLESSVAKFRFGNPAGAMIGWTGTTLEIKGVIKILTNTSEVQSGVSSAGLYLGADKLGYYDGAVWKSYLTVNGNFFLSGSSGTQGLTWLAATSTLAIDGTLTARGGIIGGLTITYAAMWIGTGTFNATNTDFYVGKSGSNVQFSIRNKVVYNGATDVLTLSGFTVTSTSIRFGGTDSFSDVANMFFVNTTGYFRIGGTTLFYDQGANILYLNTNCIFSGSLTGVSGDFGTLSGGVLIVGSTSLERAKYNTNVTASIMAFSSTRGSSDVTDRGLWLGWGIPDSAPFFVNMLGQVRQAKMGTNHLDTESTSKIRFQDLGAAFLTTIYFSTVGANLTPGSISSFTPSFGAFSSDIGISVTMPVTEFPLTHGQTTIPILFTFSCELNGINVQYVPTALSPPFMIRLSFRRNNIEFGELVTSWSPNFSGSNVPIHFSSVDYVTANGNAVYTAVIQWAVGDNQSRSFRLTKRISVVSMLKR